MSIEKLYEIDRRALDLGLTLRQLALKAEVGVNTVARFKQDPGKVNPRTVNKLIRQLERMETERANS